jgi:Response regulator containing CheY-like receiver, AAA-type ATPase, and DNA-binding domains
MPQAMELCVMIVDDDPIFRLMAKVMLRHTGIADDPYTCIDGEEALAVIGKISHPDTTILIFLDINMPTLNGWQVLERLTRLKVSSPVYVVIVTSSIDKADEEQAKMYEHVIGYLVKPINREQLEALKTSAHLSNLQGRRC